MAQKYCKVSVAVGIGNRKSSVIDPVEVEEAVNTFDGELNTLVVNFVDAVKSLPGSDGTYSRDDIIQSLCDCFELQRKPNNE